MLTALHREACAELPACTLFLPPEPALMKVSRNSIQPVGLRLSQANQSCTAVTNQSGYFNQDSALWANQTTRIWSSHLRETDHSRTMGRDFCPCKNEAGALAGWLSWWEHHSPYVMVVGSTLSQGTYKNQPMLRAQPR